MTFQGLWVVKIGGVHCEEESARRSFGERCAALPKPVVVVHGGGRQASDLQRRLGGAPSFVEGRRVTTPEALGAVEMALCGVVNKALVRELIASGLRAVGLSGCDGALVRCDRVEGLGEVGSPAAVEGGLLEALLLAGFTPVVAPISLGPSGEALNVNADEIAAAIAAALRAERLLLISDVPGVSSGGAIRDHIDVRELDDLIARSEVTGGMVPKLRSASKAVLAGVGEVVIGGFDGRPLPELKGTRVSMRGGAPGSSTGARRRRRAGAGRAAPRARSHA